MKISLFILSLIFTFPTYSLEGSLVNVYPVMLNLNCYSSDDENFLRVMSSQDDRYQVLKINGNQILHRRQMMTVSLDDDTPTMRIFSNIGYQMIITGPDLTKSYEDKSLNMDSTLNFIVKSRNSKYVEFSGFCEGMVQVIEK